MELTQSLNVESFNEFIRCLTNLKEVCNDADIRGGILRQRTNNHTSVFEVDLRAIFDEANIALTNLKQKLELLKTFQGQDVEVTIDEPDDGTLGSYTFKDTYSSIRFVSPTMDFMDNKFMTEEELTAIFPSDEDHLILERELPQLLTDRIRIISHQFSIETVRVDFNGETASITAATPSKDQSATFAQDIMMNEEIENSSTNISNVAFSMDHETDIKYTMFKHPDQNVALNKFETTIGDIDINVYSRSQIIETDEG
jgi:hypothetical protein